MNNGVVSALTVDVEDYFQVSGFEDVISRASWENFESRVEESTDRLLEILANACVSATFFMLGWTAERHPNLVRRIQAAGHELGCHSYAHRLVYKCTREEFREDTRRAKKLIEDLSGERVIGYRAPSFSITRRSLWALEILAEEGFEYDSSIYPILRDRYGIPSAPRYPYRILLGDSRASVIESVESIGLLSGNAAGSRPREKGAALSRGGQLAAGSKDMAQQRNNSTDSKDSRDSIVEFPPSTIRLLGLSFPIGGGGYLRLFPQSLFNLAIRHIVERERRPAILYIHPWELDPEQPRLTNGSPLSRFRQYVNLHETENRLKSLLARWRFSCLRDLLVSRFELPVKTVAGLSSWKTRSRS